MNKTTVNMKLAEILNREYENNGGTDMREIVEREYDLSDILDELGDAKVVATWVCFNNDIIDSLRYNLFMKDEETVNRNEERMVHFGVKSEIMTARELCHSSELMWIDGIIVL